MAQVQGQVLDRGGEGGYLRIISQGLVLSLTLRPGYLLEELTGKGMISQSKTRIAFSLGLVQT